MDKEMVEVEVKSGWLSKINWTQIVSFLAMLLTLLGFDLSPEDQVKIVTAIAAIGQLVTMFFRIFKTKQITKASAASLE